MKSFVLFPVREGVFDISYPSVNERFRQSIEARPIAANRAANLRLRNKFKDISLVI